MAQDEKMLVPETGWTVEQTVSQLEQEATREGLPASTVHRLNIAATTIRSLAAPAQPAAVEGAAEPVAWARRWFVDGITPKKERNENGRMAWPKKFTLHEVTPSKIMTDDVALYAHPSPPADDALRVAVEAWDELAKRPSWEINFSGFDEEDGWSVHSVTGGVNDREWDELARAETPLEAVLAALKAGGEVDGCR